MGLKMKLQNIFHYFELEVILSFFAFCKVWASPRSSVYLKTDIYYEVNERIVKHSKHWSYSKYFIENIARGGMSTDQKMVKRQQGRSTTMTTVTQQRSAETWRH